MKDRAAISRIGLGGGLDVRSGPRGTRAGDSAPANGDGRISVSLAQLRGLAAGARGISLMPRQPAQSVLQGRHRTRIRGRGLDFEDLRGYVPGDDVRAMDWKVTARMRAPYVRVYAEERDRPTLVVVDQRMAMFFGTVHNTKAVTAAECAAIAAHLVVAQGDRLGGLIFGDQQMAQLRPARGAMAVTRFLTELVAANGRLSAEALQHKTRSLNDVLKAVRSLAHRDHLIVIISDFDAVDAGTEHHLGALTQHNDLILGVVSDPAAQHVPEQGHLTVTDGQKQAVLPFGDAQARAGLMRVSADRAAVVAEWQARLRLSVLGLSTAQDTLPQVVRLLGGGSRQSSADGKRRGRGRE